MMLSPIVLLSAITLAFVQNSLGDDGEYGGHSTFRKAMCESGNQEMLRGMEKCFQMKDKDVQDAASECAKKAKPDYEGDTVAFMIAACQDTSLFKKLDDCFAEYTSDPDFEKKMQLSDEAIECSKGVIEEYNIESLRNYFEDSSSTESK